MNSFLLRMLFCAAVIASGFTLACDTTDAADLQATPSIWLGQGWDSNIFGTSTNEVSDFYFTARPELAFAVATQTLSLRLSGGIEGRWYYRYTDLNSWNYSEFLRLIGGWNATPRFTVTPAAYYLETSNQTQRALLIPNNPTLPPPGLATFGLQTVRNYGGSIGLGYLATPKVETNGTVYAVVQQYPDQPLVLTDSETYGADVTVRYLLSPRSSLGVYVAASYADFEATPDTRVLATGIFGGYQFSANFRFDGRLGMAFARQPATSVTPAQTTNDPAGSITLGYTDNTFHANLYANVGYSGLSGSGGITRQGTAGFDIGDQITQRWSWSLGGIYQISRTVFAADATDVSTATGTAGIRYAPWQWGSFDLTGNANRQWSDVPGASTKDLSVVLGLTLSNTYIVF